MKKNNFEIGDILQLNPEHNFAGQLIVVTEPKEFGAQGILFLEYETEGLTRYEGRAFARVTFSECKKVGKVEWMRIKRTLT